MLRAIVFLLVYLTSFASSTCLNAPHLVAGTIPWSTQFPALVDGNSVTIPQGSKILLDVDTPRLKKVLIEGELIFSQGVASLELKAEAVIVASGGWLRVGSECCPYTSLATITLLKPASEGDDHHGVGTKVLGVLGGGNIELYGDLRGPSWTEVAATAAEGASTIVLKEAVDWAVGDSIVIAPTDFHWDYSQERVITAISMDKKTITLDAVLDHGVYGATDPTSGFAEYAEVGLLTRNIKVVGEDSDIGTTFGGHIMVLGNPATAHFRAIEVVNGGQRGALGRYPIHFHLSGQVGGAYVYDSSVHHSKQRCIVIHGTHNLRVRRNVVFHTQGHCIFIEDAIETQNLIEYNLILHVAKADSPLVPSDTSATGVWLTHPDNRVNYNRVAGIDSHCMWIALPEHPLHTSFNDQIWNRKIPLLEFNGNQVHSCSRDGLHVDTGPKAGPPASQNTETVDYYPQIYNPADGSMISPVISWVNDFKAWKVQDGAVWCRCGVYFKRLSHANCARGMTFASNEPTRSQLGYLGYVTQSVDALAVAETDNLGKKKSWQTGVGLNGRSCPKYNDCAWPIRGFEVYDGPSACYNCKFVGFDDNAQRTAGAFSDLFENEFSVTRLNHVKDAELVNSKGVNFPLVSKANDGSRGTWLSDITGHLTGYPPVNGIGAAIVQDFPIYLTSGCDSSRFNTWGAHVCPNHFSELRVAFVTPKPGDYDPLGSVFEVLRDDLPEQSKLILCGTGVNCPHNFTKEGAPLFPDNLRFPAIAGKRYHVRARTEPPQVVQLDYSYTSNSLGRTGIANDVFVKYCYPEGTTVTEFRWDYGKTWGSSATNPIAGTMAASLAEFYSTPVVSSYSEKGKKMYFVEDVGGSHTWVHVRLQALANRTFNISDNQHYSSSPGCNVRFKVNRPSTARFSACTHSEISPSVTPDRVSLPPYVNPSTMSRPARSIEPAPPTLYGDPVCINQPTSLAPTSLAPTSVAPTSLTPTSAAPTSFAPTSAAPTQTTRVGGTFSPTSKAPTSLAPTSNQPTSKSPTSKAPTSKAPTTKPPTFTNAPTAPGQSSSSSTASFCIILCGLIVTAMVW